MLQAKSENDGTAGQEEQTTGNEHDGTAEKEEQTAASEHDGTAEQEEQTTASEHDGTAEQEEQTLASANNKFEYKIFRGTKYPKYQPETPSAVLIKYLVENDKEKQAEPPVDPIDAFFKSTAATVKTFSPYHQNFASQEYLRLYLKWK